MNKYPKISHIGNIDLLTNQGKLYRILTSREAKKFIHYENKKKSINNYVLYKLPAFV